MDSGSGAPVIGAGVGLFENIELRGQATLFLLALRDPERQWMADIKSSQSLRGETC